MVGAAERASIWALEWAKKVIKGAKGLKGTHFFYEMCTSATLNPRFRGSILALHVLYYADSCHIVMIVRGNTLRLKKGDVAFHT